VARLSQIQKQLQLSFSEPWFLDRPLSAGVDLQKVFNDYQEAGLPERRLGLVAAAGFPGDGIFQRPAFSIMYKIQNIKVLAPRRPKSRWMPAPRTVRWSATATSMPISTTLLKPNNGVTLSFGQNFAGFGGTLRYLETTGNRRALPRHLRQQPHHLALGQGEVHHRL